MRKGKENKKKVPKITQEQYEEYIMSLKEERPSAAFLTDVRKDKDGVCANINKK